MKITVRCPPELRELVPPPRPARAGLPDWLRAMPNEAEAEELGFTVRTVKQCPPFVDAMGIGLLFLLPCDVEVRDGRFTWSWDVPASTLGGYSRAPMSFHSPAQASGAPFFAAGRTIVKFNNFWTVELPDGWSLLAGHPANRLDLPFRTLTGLVDADLYRDAFVQFPALWTDPGFEDVLPRGTPVAQAVPVRREALELDVDTLAGEAADRFRDAQAALAAEPGAYRKRWRARKG